MKINILTFNFSSAEYALKTCGRPFVLIAIGQAHAEAQNEYVIAKSFLTLLQNRYSICLSRACLIE